MPSILLFKLWKYLPPSNQVRDSIQPITIPGSSSSFYLYTHRGQVGQGPNVEGSYVHVPTSILEEPNPIICGLLEPRGELLGYGYMESFLGLGLDDREFNNAQHTFFAGALLYSPFLYPPTFFLQNELL
jgi:hypothetical protein